MALTPKQEMFVQEYLKDLNATQAAIRAGYSTRSARQTAARMLTNDDIASRLAELKTQRAQRVQVEQDDVLRELLLVLKSSVNDYTIGMDGKVGLGQGVNPEAVRAVSKVKRKMRRTFSSDGSPIEEEEIELKLWNKDKAIELGMRHLGLITDRFQLEDPKDVLARILGLPREDLP